jgi:CheY-like chemotaxis protein
MLAGKLLPDVIFMSMAFTNLHGMELCTRLRQNPSLVNTRIVALVSVASPEIDSMYRAAGFDQWLLKPIAIADLIDIIDPDEGDRVRQLIGV